MKDRRLQILNLNYWQENSPMRILSAEYDQQAVETESDKKHISLTIQNISNQTIIAVKGSLRIYDIFKDYLDDIQFKWTNITLDTGKTEESAQSIRVPNETVHIELVIEQVVFNDFSVYELDNDLLFLDEEIPKQYYCKCGAINPNYNQKCHKCGLDLKTENMTSSMSRFHDRLNSDEKISYADASLGKIHIITTKNRIFAYGSNELQQADPSNTAKFINNWQEITASLTIETGDPIVSILGRIAVSQNGRMFTWGLSNIPEDINPFTHNGILIDPLALESIYEYLLPKFSGLNLYEFKISQNFDPEEMVIKAVATNDFMTLFILTNKNKVFYWSYNQDQVLVYVFDPYNLTELKKTPNKINDITVSENALLLFDDESVYLYGHNYLKSLFEGQYNNYFKQVYIPEFSYSSKAPGLLRSSRVKNVIANKFYKAFIIQYDNDVVFYMGHTSNFYSRPLNADRNYKTGLQITEAVSQSKLAIKKLFFQRLALSLLMDNSIYFWGIFSSDQYFSFRHGLDITSIFPLNEEENIVDYFSDPGKLNPVDGDPIEEYDQYFITSENRLFASKFNDFLIAAKVAKTSHFKIRELDIKI